MRDAGADGVCSAIAGVDDDEAPAEAGDDVMEGDVIIIIIDAAAI